MIICGGDNMGKLDSFTEDQLRKIVSRSKSLKELSYNLGYTKGANNARIINKYLDKYNISTNHFETRYKQQHTYQDDEVFTVNSKAAQTTLRRRYSKGNYSEYRCAICGQEPVWNDRPLTLVLDHINGINNDNRLENLRWVCPNCDHQLDTFCAKNQKKIIKKQYYCVDCGAEIDRTATRCVKCNGV
jgi:DNA-directed RNA polymerase subunit RPC12/RpoP